jgi:hypothetical protein
MAHVNIVKLEVKEAYFIGSSREFIFFKKAFVTS